MATQEDSMTEPKMDTESMRETISRKAEELRDQAVGKAQEYAGKGKDKASGALENVARFFDDTAGSLDDRLGSEIGG